MDLKFAHIINPFVAKPGSSTTQTQAMTLQSFRNALAAKQGDYRVEVCTVQLDAEPDVAPDFKSLPSLSRTVADLHQFTRPKPYPLIADVLKQAENVDATHLIFSNMDIILMPHFYDAVAQYIEAGHDALIINRRRIANRFSTPEQLPIIYSEIGKSHPGFDCFVFKKSLFSKFILEHICVGVPFIGVSLAHNLFAFSSNYKLLDEQHLTVHLGLEVMPSRDSEYHAFNRLEFAKIERQLKPHLSPEKLPYTSLPFYRRVLKWGLNPSVFIAMNLQLEAEGFFGKLRMLYNELRFKLLETL